MAQEFDLILRRPPSVPCRLDEKGKSETNGLELQALHSSEKQVTNQSTLEASHYMALLSTTQENDGISNIYHSLNSKRQISQEASEEIHGERYSHNNTYQSLIPVKEGTNSSESGHYQSLSLKKAFR